MVVMRGEETEPVSGWVAIGVTSGEDDLSRLDQISG
jgi:hypothetical protein